jgi:hypothetical protein
MSLLRMLMRSRNVSGAGSSGGMLLVMMALAGLLTQKHAKQADGKRL